MPQRRRINQVGVPRDDFPKRELASVFGEFPEQLGVRVILHLNDLTTAGQEIRQSFSEFNERDSVEVVLLVNVRRDKRQERICLLRCPILDPLKTSGKRMFLSGGWDAKVYSAENVAHEADVHVGSFFWKSEGGYSQRWI